MDYGLRYFCFPILALANDRVQAAVNILLRKDIDFDISSDGLNFLFNFDVKSTLFKDPADVLL